MIERAKSFIKSVFPSSVRTYRRIKGFRSTLNAGTPGIESIFSDIYRNNSWADPESVSGRGSTLTHTGDQGDSSSFTSERPCQIAARCPLRGFQLDAAC